MSNIDNNVDPMLKLRLKNEKLLRDYSYFDRTDTVSIASIQSSIFDLDSSLTSCNFEKVKSDTPMKANSKVNVPFKRRPFKFKDKVPENWLYSNPKQKIIENDNPIQWMRTIFDENEIIPSCKSNLKQTLSKSHANLITNFNFEFDEELPSLVSYKSVSDLKTIEISNNLKRQDEMEKSNHIMTESRTAPGSIENVTEIRSSFQDFVALAKQQEERLKAEVLKRKLAITENKNSNQSKQIPSVRYIKNNRKSVPINRFGFTDFNPIPSGPRKVTTRYSRVNTNQTKQEVIPNLKPKFSLQMTDISQKSSEKSRIQNSDNLRKSADYKSTIKLYKV